MTSEKSFSERDICTQFILPALIKAGWHLETQIREEVTFMDGRIYVKGKLHARGKRNRVDYILYYNPNILVAIIEAKDSNHPVGAGLQQRLGHATTLDILVFQSSYLVNSALLSSDKTASGKLVVQVDVLIQTVLREEFTG